MLSIIVSACVLVALTMYIHASGIAVLLRGLMKLDALPPTRVWPITRMLFRMIWWLILIHLAEISVWAFFYLWRGCMPNAEAAFYFSGVTYTTIGYGDLVLAKPWRLLGPIEGLVGILMCGLSTGYFFVVVSRVYQWRHVKATVVPTTGGTQKEP
jgi:ion channel